MKKTLLAVTILSLLPLLATATELGDLRYEALPKAMGGELRLGTLDRALIEREDQAREQLGRAPRHAIPHRGQYNTTQVGQWTQRADGSRIWTLQVSAVDADHIGLGFRRFELPEGAYLRLLDAEGRPAMRDFTADDNATHGELWTPIVLGNRLSVELSLPANSKFELELSQINQGYRGFRAQRALKSGSCNVDVACPQGADWKEQIDSVAVIGMAPFGTFCTGFAVNNAEHDGRPYFMTAHHCEIRQQDAAGLIAYWNYQHASCRTPGSGASGQSGNGQLNQFNTGAYFRSSFSGSDFTLVEFDQPIDPSYNVYLAGWDRRNIAPPAAIAVHHPNTDEKRISFEDQPTTITNYLGSASNANGSHIRVADWDLGTTEGGSSGSPLFSPEGLVVGQLHGGYAACGNNLADWYGRFARSWTGGNSSATRLSDWLDPQGRLPDTLPGRRSNDRIQNGSFELN